MAAQRSPLKHKRLLQLKGAGLNTVDFLCYPPGQLNIKEIKELFRKHGRISFRQFVADSRIGNMREKFDMTDLGEFFAFVKANRSPYGYALINQGVDLEANTIRGCLWWLDLYKFRIECFVGPGSPRWIEKKGKETLIEIPGDADEGFGHTQNWNGDYSGLFKELIIQTRGFLTDIRPLIIEFEWHTTPLGWKPSHWLFWEWRLAPVDPRDEQGAEMWDLINNQIRRLRQI